ncbi:MAG TPA: hypothetical protein VM324_06580 [Egibacteraceae bacterium]|nr:hypothetical protein [Egibacteraceae bacterium]
MPLRWHDVERFTVQTATADLLGRGEVRPLLVGFMGEEQCVVAFLRGFPNGAYTDPIIEVLALAMALGADRLAFAAAGRLTSLDDPIPPVTEDADLRQRALVVEYADGAGPTPLQHSCIHPFTLSSSGVVWDVTLHLTGGRGWIPDALRIAVSSGDQLAGEATDADIRSQAERCVTLGHDLALGPTVRARLGLPRGCY